MAFISLFIFVGISLLIYLHIKLTKYDFTTYEYIQYSNDRKERLMKLKKKKMTKERFDELEQKALSKTSKKRSKIIKEVTEDREKRIIEKLRHKHHIGSSMEEQIFDEESKTNNQSSTQLKNEKPKPASETQQGILNKQMTEHNSIRESEMFDNMNTHKEYIIDDSVKRKNNFW